MAEKSTFAIGECEFCGCDSDAAAQDHIICTRCREIIENELWGLQPDEPARKAYERARPLCRLRGKIATQRDENKKLRDEIDHLQKEIERLKSKTAIP